MLFSVKAEHGIGGTLVRVCGEIDLSVRRVLLDELVRATRRHDPHLLLDLSGVTFIDCAGLSALVKARRCAEDSGGSLHVVAVQSRVRRVIHLVGLTDLLSPRVGAVPAHLPHQPSA